MRSAPKQDFQQEFNTKREKFMTNGTIHEEEDFEKPADIEADIKDMEKRKRVSYIMNSDAFRAELESIVDYQLNHGPHPASVMALQNLADMLMASGGSGSHSAPKGAEAQQAGAPATPSKASGNVPPIADLRGVDASGYSKGERFLRCKLAALFRLVEEAGWNGSYSTTHISARVSGEQETILINPTGLQYKEVSASTLVKVDHHGNVLHAGSTTFSINKSGTALHTALHQARPDVRCILHLQQSDVQAVSSLKHGLLRTSVESCVLGTVPSHEFFGVNITDDEKESLARDLGAVNKVLLLSNQGAVICGATIEETWKLTTLLVQACKVQLQCLQAVGGNSDNLNLISEDVAQKTYQHAWAGDSFDEGKQWKFGEMLFESQMRDLDNTGLRSGYIYKNPLIKIPTKPKFDVEVPPASSSMGYFSDTETLKATRNTRDRYIHSGGYERIEAEIFSDGDTPDDTKTKIKWVRKEAAGDQIVKIDGPHQFAPVLSGKQEMKAKINTMKDDRDLNKSTSGYQSKILDGLSETDARKYQEVQGVNPNAVAAFSKGIIQKDYQKDAVILTDYSAPNPFEAVTDDEVENYRKQAERRAQGLPAEEPPSPSTAQDKTAASQTKSKKDKDKKTRSATMPAPPAQPVSPAAPHPVASDTETGVESGLDKGMTTGGETENEGTGTLDGKGKGKPAKKAKSFKNPFSGKSKKN